MQSVYAEPGYLKIWAKYDQATPLEIHLNNEGGVFKINLLLKPIPGGEEFYEAYSPYGYGGPVLVEGDCKARFPFEKFIDILKDNHIINAFLRFSPFITNHVYFPEQLISLNRHTISRMLEKTSLEELLKTFSQNTREKLKKNTNSGMGISILRGDEINEEIIGRFHQLYTRNMKEVGASEYYFFSRECIKDHFTYLRHNIDLFIAHFNEQWVAATMFLIDEQTCHYHLGASEREYSRFYPVYRNFFEAIFYYGNLGKKLLHFGGGLSLDPEDSLFLFKKKFGSTVSPFFISKIIIDEPKYLFYREFNKVAPSAFFLINDALANLKK